MGKEKVSIRLHLERRFRNIAKEQVAEAARDAFFRKFREHPRFKTAVVEVRLNPKEDYFVVVYYNYNRAEEFPDTIQNVPVKYKDGSISQLY